MGRDEPMTVAREMTIAARSLLRVPGPSAISIAVLAVGLGAVAFDS